MFVQLVYKLKCTVRGSVTLFVCFLLQFHEIDMFFILIASCMLFRSSKDLKNALTCENKIFHSNKFLHPLL